jgi:chromosome segregation ATPase
MTKDARHGKANGQAEDAASSRGSLAAAAAALEADLERLDNLAANIRKMPLNSRKNVERAARALQEAAGYEEVLGGRLHGLVAALNAASERQRASLEIIAARGRDIGERNAVFGELFGRFTALGEEARQLTAVAQEIVAVVPGEEEAERSERVKGRLQELIERMGHVAAGAAELARDAEARDMSDLAREVDALKQQVAAARNKLGLLRQKIEAGQA